MTDLQHFREMLSSANLSVIRLISSDGGGTRFEIENSGYTWSGSAYSTWQFDPAGKLVEITHWRRA